MMDRPDVTGRPEMPLRWRCRSLDRELSSVTTRRKQF
jgi:hypothetical protein